MNRVMKDWTGESSQAFPAARSIALAVTAVLIGFGIYARFLGLEKSPFAIDEYYIATSVKSILEHGLPRFHGGGFYDRGILVQYLVAPLFLSGMSHEFAFRLVTVLFNLAALPAVFLLAHRLAGLTAGCAALILFSLSLWEVEFARFARMYAPFGTLAIWHLYCLHRVVFDGDQRAMHWMLVLSALAILVSEFAILLVGLNFVPLLFSRQLKIVSQVTVPAILLAVTVVYTMVNFRRFGVTDFLPPDMPLQGSGLGLPVHLPPILLTQVPTAWPWLAGLALVILLAAIVAVGWLWTAVGDRSPVSRRWTLLLPIGVPILAMLHQFGLLVLAGALAVLWFAPARQSWPGLMRRRLVQMTILLPPLALAYWFAVAVHVSPGEAMLYNATGHPVKDAVLLLFDYPPVYAVVVLQWMRAMPVQTAVMALLITFAIWQALRRENVRDEGYLLLTGAVIAICIIVAVIDSLYTSTRYTYAIYSAVLILAAVAIVRLTSVIGSEPRRLAALGAVLATLIVVSEDFSLDHLLAIDSDRVTYRMEYGPYRTDHFYARHDFRSLAAFVNEQKSADDIVISAEYALPYYLERMDYLYMDRLGGRFHGISGQSGTRDIWEGAPLLSSADDLLDVITSSRRTVWLIARTEVSAFRTDGEIIAEQAFAEHRAYRSVDGHFAVYRIPPGVTVTADNAASPATEALVNERH
ncbi:hypothetical protein J2T57_002962 [Natronocella acetinitrilica]|uniref:Glycosyltransferase RgtA/B/C/D-like domain-containing protein n=1 Tax=Natronocella acetinitrilica TaxID=414046 RepID=A0AAE3G8K7_9GAMM|nr:glycosyltransferase family 39 protein [Natronocella acetinitrilica]MCP1675807.1 hypothetical protein [Natronocella acetinitrilica]